MSSTIENAKVEHLPKSILPKWMLEGRTKILAGDSDDFTATDTKSVAYLMQRDVRTKDNWALLLAAHFAQQRQVPLCIIYALPPPPDETNEEIPDLKDLPMTERHGYVCLH